MLISVHFIFAERCLSILGRGRRVGVFVSIGGTGILFHLLVTASKETMPSEELMLQLHLLLAKVGPKGRTVSHLNRCTHHSAGFKTYTLICETIVFSFPSNCLSNPTDFVSMYISGEKNLKNPLPPIFQRVFVQIESLA